MFQKNKSYSIGARIESQKCENARQAKGQKSAESRIPSRTRPWSAVACRRLSSAACRLLCTRGIFQLRNTRRTAKGSGVQVEQIKCSDAKLHGSYSKTKPAPGLSATCTSSFSRLFECFVVELPCGVAEASAPDVERVSKPVHRRVCGAPPPFFRRARSQPMHKAASSRRIMWSGLLCGVERTSGLKRWGSTCFT